MSILLCILIGLLVIAKCGLIKNQNKFDEKINYMMICGLSIILITAIICIILYYRRKWINNRTKKQMVIGNGMVILIAVGDYDDAPNDPAQELLNGILPDLDIEHDIANLHNLFGAKNLNFTIYPQYEDPSLPRLHWSQKEILDLLESKAKELDENEKYDGLIVVLSSHGIAGHICCSDYRLIQKLAIHRIFTRNYERTRNIPRIFLFDGCEGDDERHGVFGETPTVQAEDDEIGSFEIKYKDDNDIKVNDSGKNFKETDIEQKYNTVWAHNTKSADYKLAQVHAANPGFQAKANSEIGSYMIYEFVSKVLDDLNNNKHQNDKFIGEIFDDIQTDLESAGKQHIVAIYNDMTRWIRFRKNHVIQNNSNIEMVQSN